MPSALGNKMMLMGKKNLKFKLFGFSIVQDENLFFFKDN